MLKKLTLAVCLLAFVGLPTVHAANNDTVNVGATVTAYAQVDCADPSNVVLTTTTSAPGDTPGYTSGGAQSISCNFLTNSANAAINLTLGGANYTSATSKIQTTHTVVNTEHVDLQLSSPSGFNATGDQGLITGGSFDTPTNETETAFGWSINAKASTLTVKHLAGSYTGAFTATLSGY